MAEYRNCKRLKIATLITVVLFALGMIAGCGQSDNTGTESMENTDTEKDSPDYYTVTDEIDSSANEGIGTLTAYQANGTEVWSVRTEAYPMTELSKTYDIGEQGNGYYIEAGGTVYCFDKETGSLLWKNAAFGGAASAAGFDENGNLYICGYYGPMLCVITPDGEMLHKYEEPLFRSSAYEPGDYYWPTNIHVYTDYVEITFDSTGDTLCVNPENGHTDFEPGMI